MGAGDCGMAAPEVGLHLVGLLPVQDGWPGARLRQLVWLHAVLAGES